MRRRRGKKRAGVDGLTKCQRYDLLRGIAFFMDTWGNGTPEQRLESRRENWKKYRAQLLAEWMTIQPGTRPAAWWQYEAPEPRRRIGGGPSFDEEPGHEWARQPHIDERLQGNNAGGLSFGVCSVTASAQFKNPPIYETEQDYLQRHKLLTPEEHQALDSRKAKGRALPKGGPMTIDD